MECLPLTVTVPEACRLTGLGRTAIFKLIMRGQLESAHVCGRRLINFKSLQTAVSTDTLHTKQPAN